MDFMRWNGVPFGTYNRKTVATTEKQNPVTEIGNTPLLKSVTPPLPKSVTLHGTTLPKSVTKGAAQPLPKSVTYLINHLGRAGGA
jgi:hypothetical protein